jgi:hypothetical protein
VQGGRRVLRFRQNRDQQAVIVGDQARVLPVQVAQSQAQAAPVRHPLPEERAAEPVPARADDAEHGRNIAEGHPIGNVPIFWPDGVPLP